MDSIGENLLIIDDNSLDENLIEYQGKLKKKLKADLCDDITSNTIPSNLEELEFQIDRLKQRWNEFTYLIGQRLKYIHNNKLFEGKGYLDFSTYIRAALKMSENNAYYYISVFDYFTEEQTKIAGSKLKLIIPVLNKVKRDKSITEDLKKEKIDDLKNSLYMRIKNKSYRDAEKEIKDIRKKYFFNIENKIKKMEKIIIKNDRIIIYEEDINIKEELFNLIEKFYNKKNLNSYYKNKTDEIEIIKV